MIIRHSTIFVSLCLAAAICRGQVNSGSNGTDGAFNPTQNVTIDMADHPDGIYQYTSVNIPVGVTVSFTPNAGNAPVIWLIQGNCVISGTIQLSGNSANGGAVGAVGGPGGGRGGNGGSNPTSGQGPGGGTFEPDIPVGLSGVYANSINGPYGTSNQKVYGNSFLLPLLGGSGGGGDRDFVHAGYNYAHYGGAGGGGGAFLIAAQKIILNGHILANGGAGNGDYFAPHGYTYSSGSGSGGGIRLIATELTGSGVVSANSPSGATGRIRLDYLESSFGGTIHGAVTQGFQPIIIPAPSQGVQLAIQSVAGNSVPANPSGVLANPDVIIPAQQANPIPIVVRCTNIPLNTEISVVVHPANGPDVQAVALNNSGTNEASTAAVSLNLPRGGGIIYAKAITGVARTASKNSKEKNASLAQTGWTADGESFREMEIIATLGGSQRIAYITKSGKRHELPAK